jgi:hypothetical protein
MTPGDPIVDTWIDDFRKSYEDDARNAARQPFEEYWGWVKAFLVSGGAGQRGWLDQGEEVLRRVGDSSARDDLRRRVHALGRTIAAEWAKQSRHRRIHTTLLQGSPNLQDWGRRLDRAAAKETGDGVSIEQALDAIERDLQKALRA